MGLGTRRLHACATCHEAIGARHLDSGPELLCTHSDSVSDSVARLVLDVLTSDLFSTIFHHLIAGHMTFNQSDFQNPIMFFSNCEHRRS